MDNKQIKKIMHGFEKEKQRRDLKKAVKTHKRNRDDRPPRQKNWETADEVQGGFERIMPLGEKERRQKVTKVAVGYFEEGNAAHEAKGTEGVVIEVSTGLCRVSLNGEILLCRLRGSLSLQETGYTNVVAVGDKVIVAQDGQGGGVVEAVLPRHNMLARPDTFYGHLQQVIAANLDQLLIVASWRNPHFWPELVDRYLITAGLHDLEPIICVNKTDLAESQDEILTYLQPYQMLGHRLILTSAITGEGLDELREALAGKITVLSGMSGVGKSSLLSAVQPGFELRVHEVSEHSGEGQHTTTQATMLPFGEDGFVVDTPGIRTFGLAELDPAELVEFYPEFLRYVNFCQFGNCSHTHEPGCAVTDAVQKGQISDWRYYNYQKLYKTL